MQQPHSRIVVAPGCCHTESRGSTNTSYKLAQRRRQQSRREEGEKRDHYQGTDNIDSSHLANPEEGLATIVPTLPTEKRCFSSDHGVSFYCACVAHRDARQGAVNVQTMPSYEQYSRSLGRVRPSPQGVDRDVRELRHAR